MRREDAGFAAWFWNRVQVGGDAECWPWKGRGGVTRTDTHKVIGLYGGRGKPQDHVLAHRVAYELGHGSIPFGLCVLHECDNPSCCNPMHLFLGTKGDNIRDARDKRRALIGTKNPCARLTEEQVLEIRRLHALGNATYAALGKQFNVDKSTIYLIVKRRKWKHI